MNGCPKQRRAGPSGRALAIATSAALVTGAGCSTPDPVTGKRTYNVYSLQEDISLGQSALAANTRKLTAEGVPVNRDRARLNQLNGLVERVAAVSHLPDLPYTITLYESEIVNAAAAPGGSIMVFSGLYAATNALVHDDDELAAVMAHEIAHVTCRHVTERLSMSQSINVVGQAADLAATILGFGDVYSVARNVFSVGSAIWLPAYSRKDEAEADRVGLLYMADAGYDPQAAIRLWQRAADQDKGGVNPLSIFASHPSHMNRAGALAPLLPEAMDRFNRSTYRRE